MKYEVYVQDKLVKTFEDKSTGKILSIISKEIQDGSISIDETQPHNIKIISVNN
jgi:hypothetical protein